MFYSGTFHLLHVLLEDYIAHTLESILDKEQESVFSERISALKKPDVLSDGTEELYSAPRQLHGSHTSVEATPLKHSTDFSIAGESQCLQLPDTTLSGISSLSAEPSLEDLHASSSSTAVGRTSVAPILPPLTTSPTTSTPHLATAGPASTSHGQVTHLLTDTAASGLSRGASAVAPPPSDSVDMKQRLGSIVNPPNQLGFPGGVFPNSLPSLHPQSHHHRLMFGGTHIPSPLSSTLLGGGTVPPGHTDSVVPPPLLPTVGQQPQSIAQPAAVSLPSVQMPLSHTGMHPGLPTQIPHSVSSGGSLSSLLPTMATGIYPYAASYGGIPPMLPVQPSSTGMLRVNASPFPSQPLVSMYSPYIPQALYSTNSSQSSTDFTR